MRREAAPAVTAALRWRGRCVFKALCIVAASEATTANTGN